MRVKFANEDFEFDELVDARIEVVAHPKGGGRIVMSYDSIKELLEDWEDE